VPGDTEGILSRIRSWMDEGSGRLIAVVVALAVIIASVGWLAVHGGGDPVRGEIRKAGRQVPYVCKACGSTGKTRVAWEAAPPWECPECHEVKAAAAFKCVKCRNIIEDPRKPVFKCPKCGYVYDSRDAGAARHPRPGQRQLPHGRGRVALLGRIALDV